MGNPYSAVKVFHHIDALNAMEKGIPIAPLYIRLKPTNVCNHHCRYCTYGSGNTNEKTANRNRIDHKDSIPWDKMQEILADIGNMGVKAVTFSGGGEPLVYPNIVEAANICTKNKIDLSLITNGQLLKGERAEAFYKAKWVRISFDSPVAEEYASIRGLKTEDYDQVINNIRKFAKNKNKRCTLGVNYVISKDNADRVYEAAKLIRELGADNIKFAAVIENEQGYHDSIKDNVIKQINKAIMDFENDRFRIINNYTNDCGDKNFTSLSFSKCYTCRLVTVIAADQKVYFCHTRAYDSNAVVGELKSQSFQSMWFSQETQNRLKCLNPINDCKNFCVYEKRNEIIQAYYDADGEHVNFI